MGNFCGIFDASIASWDAKYGYDYVRPITAIRALGDALISAWRPRSLSEALAYSTPAAKKDAEYSVAISAGLGEVRAADWEPYLPTPPFPGYVSGHSVFAAAWARAMELTTGKPDFNFKKTVRRLYVEQRELAQPVTLSFSCSFSESLSQHAGDPATVGQTRTTSGLAAFHKESSDVLD